MRIYDVKIRGSPAIIAGAFSDAPLKTTQFHPLAGDIHSNDCWFRLVSDIWHVPVGYPFEVLFLRIQVQIIDHEIIFTSMVVPVKGAW